MQFLEAKGLSGPEIEEAMKQAASQTAQLQSAAQPQNRFQSPYPTYGPAPYPSYPSQQWDWRDYFVRHLTILFVARVVTYSLQITAVISGSVVYGAVSLFKVNDLNNSVFLSFTLALEIPSTTPHSSSSNCI